MPPKNNQPTRPWARRSALVLLLCLPTASCIDTELEDEDVARTEESTEALRTTAPTELITNGSFEGADLGWSNQGFYNFDGAASAHSGRGLMYVANENRQDRLRQEIAVPDAQSASLTFWLRNKGWNYATGQFALSVRILSKDGALLQEVARYSDHGHSDALPGYRYAQQGPFDLGAYAGQTVQLEFAFVTGPYNRINFSLDDVSLVATPKAEPELLVNGGFEGTDSPWARSGLYYYRSSDSSHIGDGYILAAGLYASGRVTQDVTLASDRAASLSFWLKATGGAQNNQSSFRVRVYDTNNALLGELARYDGTGYYETPPYMAWKRQSFDLSPYRGRRIRLSFSYYGGHIDPMSFSLDTVSVLQHWDQYLPPLSRTRR